MRLSTIRDRHGVSPDILRVLNHNIYGTRAGWTARRRVLMDGLRELRPDLITFQESIVTTDYDQVADILGTGMTIIHSTTREQDGQGISIASRWPVGEVRELDLKVTSRTGDFACTALMATVQAPAPIGPVLLVNYFPDWQRDHERERVLQAVVVAGAIEAVLTDEELHVILAGDLDAEPDAASVRFLTGKQSLDGISVCYRSAWASAQHGAPCHTKSERNPLVRDGDLPFQHLDHILVRCGRQGGLTLSIAACELAFDAPIKGTWASDHFGVVADLGAVHR